MMRSGKKTLGSLNLIKEKFATRTNWSWVPGRDPTILKELELPGPKGTTYWVTIKNKR